MRAYVASSSSATSRSRRSPLVRKRRPRVIRASFTSARLTRNALNSLYQRQVNVLGLVLNCVDTEMPDYYYYRYPKYYAAQ